MEQALDSLGGLDQSHDRGEGVHIMSAEQFEEPDINGPAENALGYQITESAEYQTTGGELTGYQATDAETGAGVAEQDSEDFTNPQTEANGSEPRVDGIENEEGVAGTCYGNSDQDKAEIHTDEHNLEDGHDGGEAALSLAVACNLPTTGLTTEDDKMNDENQTDEEK